MKTSLEKIANLILSRERFLVVSHMDPDGDSIASQLGLAATLLKMGKRVTILSTDPLPKRYAFLPNSDRVRSEVPQDPDSLTVFILDCPTLDRTGEPPLKLSGHETVVNIDHHVSNQNFGDHRLVVPGASSTCELIYEIVTALGVELDPEIATDLFAGICTDTGGFKHGTTPKTFRILGKLVDQGADPSQIMNHLYEDNPLSKMKLLGLILSSLEVKDSISVLSLTQEMLRTTGSNLEESEDFTEYALSVRGAKVGILLREKGNGKIRVSLRSREPIDVDKIASLFGGGGHPQAAGCQLEGGLEEAKERLIEAVRQAID